VRVAGLVLVAVAAAVVVTAALLVGTVAGSALPGLWPPLLVAALAGVAAWLLRAAARG
jgi:hypothetical protein